MLDTINTRLTSTHGNSGLRQGKLDRHVQHILAQAAIKGCAVELRSGRHFKTA